MRATFGPEGDIRGTDVLGALVALWREGASGTIQFSRSGATAGFELAAGEVVGASSSDARFDTAAILVRAGKLDAATLERLTAGAGADRAQVALQAGVLTKREWRWGEKIRAVEVLSDLLTWIEGEYTLFRSTPREAGEFRLTIPRLVLELFLRSRDRGLVLHHLGGVDVPLVKDSRFESEFATFGLTDDAESVVRLIDGESTAAEISAEAPAEPFAVEKLLAALTTLGLVHPTYAVQDSASAPPPAPREDAPPAIEPEPDDDEEDEDEGDDAEAPVAPAGKDEGAGEFEEAEDDEDALEPEVDIGEIEVPASESLGDADGDETIDARYAPSTSPALDLDGPRADSDNRDELDELVDGPLGSSPIDRVAGEAEADAVGEDDDEAARLASDFAPQRPGPGDLEPEDAPDLREPSGFDRPFDLTTGVGSIERPRHRSSAPLLWLLVGLAAIVGAVLLWRSRGPGASPSGEPVAAADPTTTPVLTDEIVAPIETAIPSTVPVPQATAVPTRAGAAASPTAPAPTRRATSRPTAAPTARPAATAVPTRQAAPVAPPSAAAGAPAEGAPRSRRQWLARAERDQKRTSGDREARYAVQLELACEVPSISEAFAHDRPAGSMWLTTTSFRGRTCFRVMWGRYPSRDAAEAGLAAAPAFFSTPRNRPMVVGLR